MGKQFIHFRGLKPEEQGWYHNRRGAPVPVHAGDWAHLAPEEHPELRYLLESGAAVVSPSPPADVEVLDDETDPNWARNKTAKDGSRREEKVRVAQGAGLSDVHQLTQAEIERARALFLPRELPEAVADGYLDARVVDRHREPLAADVPRPFYANVVILHRLAGLLCRALHSEWVKKTDEIRAQRSGWVEEYHLEWDTDRSDLRPQAARHFPLPPEPDSSVGETLVRWGACRDRRDLSSSTLYRYRQQLGMSRQDVDRLILSALAVNRPVLVKGRIGPGFGSLNLGPHVPEGQSSILKQTTIEGVVWLELPHPGSIDDS